MKIGDRIYVRGYIDEIRKDTVIVRNDGGYFGTIPSEVITGELPPAQPEKRTEKRTKTHACDLIDRQAAIDALDVLCQEHRYKIPGKGETYSQYNEAWQDALDRAEGAIGNLPPAEPQIIRCKDCKHWIPYDWMFSEVWQSRNIADYPEDEMGCKWCDMSMKANDFCSRAERREVTT